MSRSYFIPPVSMHSIAQYYGLNGWRLAIAMHLVGDIKYTAYWQMTKLWITRRALNEFWQQLKKPYSQPAFRHLKLSIGKSCMSKRELPTLVKLKPEARYSTKIMTGRKEGEYGAKKFNQARGTSRGSSRKFHLLLDFERVREIASNGVSLLVGIWCIIGQIRHGFISCLKMGENG